MSLPKLFLILCLQILLYLSFVFLPAGTWVWERGWIFAGALTLVMLVIFFWLSIYNRDLLEERMKAPIQEEQPQNDKILLMLFILAWFGWVASIPIDIFHGQWLPKPHPFISALGLPLHLLGWFIIILVFKTNPFTAVVVKHQDEKKHKVIDTGPYSIVRHPMYAGFIPLILGQALWLESYASLLVAVVPIGVLAIRIMSEEAFLHEHLEGYTAYTQKVRYRLIPFVW